MIGKTWEADGLRLAVDVAIDPDAGIADLTGAEVEAFARREFSGASVEGAASVTGPTEITVVFAPGTLVAGTHTLQVRATIGGETQTILDDRITVAVSLT